MIIGERVGKSVGERVNNGVGGRMDGPESERAGK